MAKLDLSVNVPDDQLPRLQAALRHHFGQVPANGDGMRDRTNQELVQAVRSMLITQLKDIAKGHENVVATANITEIDAT